MSFIPLCNICKHLHDEGSFDEKRGISIDYCDAYPDGIPEAVQRSGHIYPKPGDNGIEFEPISAASKFVLEHYTGQSQAEEDEAYNWYANYYEELDMTDEEFTAKMKREHGKDWHMYKKPSRDEMFID